MDKFFAIWLGIQIGMIVLWTIIAGIIQMGIDEDYPYFFFLQVYDKRDMYIFQKVGIILWHYFGWPVYVPFYILVPLPLWIGKTVYAAYRKDILRYREKNFDKWVKQFENPVKWVEVLTAEDRYEKIYNAYFVPLRYGNYQIKGNQMKEVLSMKTDRILDMEPVGYFSRELHKDGLVRVIRSFKK